MDKLGPDNFKAAGVSVFQTFPDTIGKDAAHEHTYRRVSIRFVVPDAFSAQVVAADRLEARGSDTLSRHKNRLDDSTSSSGEDSDAKSDQNDSGRDHEVRHHAYPDPENWTDRIIITLIVEFMPAIQLPTSLEPLGGVNMMTGDALSLAAQWLKRCRQEHHQCNIRMRDFMPTRLVCTQESRPRICLGKDLDACEEYTTLSHCWGNYRLVNLSKTNIEEFKIRILEDALSQTFHDAIDVARILGFSYSWIDSLCIMQDDPADWLREAAQMSDVYGGSSLTIAASSAPDGRTGCFFPRKPTWRCQVQVKTNQQFLLYDCVPYGMYAQCFADPPLGKRAWTFQERLLSPRTLHFTSSQLFWECHQRVACEIFPDKYPDSLTTEEPYLKKQPVSRSMWSWMVQEYSGRQLTYSGDKLVAISGLARQIQNTTDGEQYVVGMWRETLEEQLCWYTLEPPSCRAVPYRAPTFSWTSIDAPVALAYEHESDYKNTYWVLVRDVRLQFVGHDPLGPVSMAKLRLSCSCLVRVVVTFRGDGDVLVELDGNQFTSVAFRDLQATETTIPDHADVCGDDDGYPSEELLFLPVLDRCDILYGLMLESVLNEPGQYQRLGLLWISGEDDVQTFRNSDLAAYQVDESEILHIQNKTEDGNSRCRYLIDLV